MNRDRFDVAAVKGLLDEAARRMLANQPQLFVFTAATRQSEWNLAHQFAVEISRLFPDYDCDVDPIKPNLGKRRPDIVIHKRGTHDDNLLAIEVKRKQADVAGEINKIRRWWFGDPLRYRFGAVVVITETEPISITILQNE